MNYNDFKAISTEQLKHYNTITMNECKKLLAEIKSIKLTEPQSYFLAMIINVFMQDIKPYLKPTDLTRNEYIEVGIITYDYKEKLTDYLQEIKRTK